jgi:serine/threonine protein kinase
MSAYRIYCGNCCHLVGEGSRFCEECGLDHGHRSAPKWTVQFGNVVTHRQAEPRQILGMFGDYLLTKKLGEGGMGRVFKVMHRKSGQEFALKVLLDRLQLKGKRHWNTLIKEAKTQAQIVHPNIVRVFDLLECGGPPGLLMEIVDGEDVDVVLRRNGDQLLSLDEVRFYASQMALGLDVVHQHGIIHADVKPANFMLGRRSHDDWIVKISDFGIARSLRSRMSSTQAKARTPGYSSPEQIMNHPIGPASDLYSLGCVIYELLIGKPVFSFENTSRCDHEHMHIAPAPIEEVRNSTPAHWAALVRDLLQKDPSSRPTSAREVAQRLLGEAA